MKNWLKIPLLLLILGYIIYYFGNLFLDFKHQSSYQVRPIKTDIDTIWCFKHNYKIGDTITDKGGFQYVILKKLK